MSAYPTVNFKISRLITLLNMDSMTKEKGAVATADRAAVTWERDGIGSQPGAANMAAKTIGSQPSKGVKNPLQMSRDLKENSLSKTPKRS